MFTAAFAGRRQMTEAIQGGHDLAGMGIDPDLLLDDLEDYVLWSMIADHRAYPAGADSMDGAACQEVAEEMVRDWHPAIRRRVAETDPATLRFLRFERSTLVEPWTSIPVTLIGGLGANTALRDAAELSSRLIAVRVRAELLPAIAGYEARMRDYGCGAVRAAA